MIAVIKRRKSH